MYGFKSVIVCLYVDGNLKMEIYIAWKENMKL